MGDGAGPGLVERGHAAAARGDWQDAFDLLMEADAAGVLSAADLPALGEVAYAAGHLDVTIEAWSRPQRNGNFCFDVTLSYRRLERPRRVTKDG